VQIYVQANLIQWISVSSYQLAMLQALGESEVQSD
jgi:hypothetical protein